MASRWGHLCPQHRSRDRRHGHPEQVAITTGRELRPYLATIDRRLRVTPDARAWTAADERWRALADDATADLAAYGRGQPMSKARRGAAEEIDRIARAATPREVWRLVAAVVMLERREPKMLRSDRAFFVQVARIVRRLRDVNVAETWDHKARRVRRIYRDPSLAVMVELGRLLSTALGTIGLTMLTLEDRDDDRRTKAKADLHAALSELEGAAEVPA